MFYYRMLRRIGLPEVHARYAPWFLKSNQIQLNRWSSVLFARLEQAFYARPEALSTLEVRMREHQAEYDAIMKPPAHARDNTDAAHVRALEPRQQNQLMLARAFRNCSFNPCDDFDSNKRRKQQQQHRQRAAGGATLASIQASDTQALAQLELIPQVAVANAPPGLAPQVRGQLESHGKHVFFAYSGRWRSGEMHGPMGVYTFSDGGKYAGEWVESEPSGAGTTVYPNGVTYTGSFVAGKFDGFGVLELPAQQQSDGPGSFSSSTSSSGGFRYEGMFKRGVRCGHGKLQLLQSGVVYEGEFLDNVRHGKGVETSPLGFSYNGLWRNNRMCGPGTLTCPDGHEAFKEQWPLCVLGEAARLVKREREEAAEQQEMWYRKLLRVRDDLRALDLQYAHWDAEDARLQGEEDARIDRLKQARREKREAQAAAKRAFTEKAAAQSRNDDDEDNDEEEEESGSGESESGEEEEEGEEGEDEEGEEGEEEDAAEDNNGDDAEAQS